MQTNKILQLQHQIATLVQKDNGSTVDFKYEEIKIINIIHYDVSVFTYNPNSNEQFLLKRIESCVKIEDGLEKIINFLKSKTEYNTYTIEWSKKNNYEPRINSYFNCHNIKSAIDKFFDGKNIDDYNIYNIKLNASS